MVTQPLLLADLLCRVSLLKTPILTATSATLAAPAVTLAATLEAQKFSVPVAKGLANRITDTAPRTAGRDIIDFETGDVGYVPQTLPHYIENTGDTDLRFLEMFRADHYEDISLSEWLSHTPPELVMVHLNIDRTTYDEIPKDKLVVTPR
ncbi:MAG: oxdD [Acidobacteriales bacterium]|nr:oxdD [Terriglobales bacterium]